MNPLVLKRLDATLWFPAAAIAWAGSWLMRFRPRDPRPLVLRPGGMGDLILLCVAAEELGCDPRSFFWVIERRSSVWARHLGLDHLCYDDEILAQHWKNGGRFSTVINSEQLFGLAQATALLACGDDSTLTCFDTNRGAWWAARRVPYDPDREHEVIAFQRLLAEGLGLEHFRPGPLPLRSRARPATEKPVVGIGGLQSRTRAFTEEEWARFIHHWAGDRDFSIASSETDRPFARRLATRFGARAEVFEGRFDELCDLISRAEDVFTVDGGLLHIASYYGTPTTSIFTSSRASKWSSLAAGGRVIRRSDLACQPCAWFAQVPRCSNGFACKELEYEKHIAILH